MVISLLSCLWGFCPRAWYHHESMKRLHAIVISDRNAVSKLMSQFLLTNLPEEPQKIQHNWRYSKEKHHDHFTKPDLYYSFNYRHILIRQLKLHHCTRYPPHLSIAVKISSCLYPMSIRRDKTFFFSEDWFMSSWIRKISSEAAKQTQLIIHKSD